MYRAGRFYYALSGNLCCLYLSTITWPDFLYYLKRIQSAFPALPNPPTNLTVIGIGPKTLKITWKFNSFQATGMNLSSFYAFYRMKDSLVGTWNVVGIPLADRTFNITDVYAVTEYRVRMSVSSTFAAGPASNEVIGKTLEGGTL